MKNRAGQRVKNLSGEAEYYSFRPQPLPPNPGIQIDDKMRELLIDAHKYILLLDALSERIVDKDLFISMYVRKEALISSQIEGTQCTLEDILDPEMDENANADVSDVINYIRAINFAIERLEHLPICNRLIKEIHSVMMNSTRGQEKTPVEFRRSQNWIGSAGSSLKNARYIPPNLEDMEQCLSDFERFINDENDMDVLIKTALIHYQFETIHPFLDGNGRVGRLLIALFLIERGLLSSPVLYMSYYLKLNRVEYYDRMSEVRRSGNYEQWIDFFLQGITETSKDAVEAINMLGELHSRNEQKLHNTPSRSQDNIKKLFNYIEHNPIIDTVKTASALSLSRNAVSKYIAILCEMGILKQSSKHGKALIFTYDEYLDILKKGT